MKVIFLDIDGVLNTKIKGVIDEDKLINLRKIIDATGTVVFINSLWSAFNPIGLSELIQRLKEWDIVCIDYIKNHSLKMKDEHVEEYLSSHPKITSYVIVDDNEYEFEEKFPNHFVKTNTRYGLTEKASRKIISILNN